MWVIGKLGNKNENCLQLHTHRRLTLPFFSGGVKLFTTAKSFLGCLAAGDFYVSNSIGTGR